MRLVKGLAVLVVLVFAAASANAGGFRLPEAGAKAMGMGFAFVAQADDPSAIYFNPAGIVQLEGQNVMVGLTYVKQNGGEFTGTTPLAPVATTETQKSLNFFIPNAYWTRKASPNFAYGVGIFAPFGLGQEYKDKNTSIFRNQITKIDLLTLVVNPTVAWKVNDVLSVGAGIDFMYGAATLEKTPVGAPGNLYNSKLEADGTAWGYNFGLLLTPAKSLKIGVSHRSPFAMDFKDGDVEVRNINPLIAPLFGGASSFDTKGSTTLHMPATTTVGIAYIWDRLTVEVDADMTWWHSYNSLDILLDRQVPPVVVNTSSPKNWNDTVAWYLGGEYRVTDPLALRAGFRWDPTPVPTATMGPELPDADKFYYSAGAGYKYSSWTFDLSYMYVDKKKRDAANFRTEGANPVGFNGEWTGNAHLVAFDAGYKF